MKSVTTKKLGGFTLIELMVAMGIFTTVLVVVTSLFLQSSKAQRLVAKRAAAIDNVSLAVEQIARELRTGSNISVIENINRVNELRFTNYKGEKVVYRLGKKEANSFIEKSSDNGVSFLPLTTVDIKMNLLDFKSISYGIPRITILTEAEGPFESKFNLQTTVSARLLYYRP